MPHADGKWGVLPRFHTAFLGPLYLAVLFLGCPLCGWAQADPPARSIPAPEMRVDINHATLEELMKVPGLTRSWAGRIVRFRPYRTKVDLLDRGIVSAEVYNRIKDAIIAHREKQ